MKTRLFMTSLLVALLAPGGLTDAFGQEQEESAARRGRRVADDDWQVKIFILAHADSQMIASVLHRLSLPASVSADAGNQAVIVRSSPDVLETVGALIAELDLPQRVAGAFKTVFVQLAHRDAEEVADLVKTVVNRRLTNIAADRVNQLVILKGPTDDLAAARELIKQVDRPQAPFRLSFFFILGDVGGAAEEEAATELPESLRPVARTLAENGFHNMELLAPIVAHVEENAEFSTSGHLSRADQGSRFEVMGRVRPAVDAGAVHLAINAEINKTVGAVNEDAALLFQVETTLVARLGDYVVLAAAPGPGDGQAIALIVRADKG